ncbi:MAG: hypothetical protein ACI35R_14465 [Bacillus sp. (in: firmicutes)]
MFAKTNSAANFNAITAANGHEMSGSVKLSIPFMKKGDRNEAVQIVSRL